ncbi:zinc finger protein 628-like [Sitodiplosis mosellana]|uniref:zinc finger protein 628-like n=1 Tax=Sitodiplosis mosellana TaxID=263140 RepID=UPI0024443A34|nr:zinc finger protein 628-like [Sitodiplosis mosellana]XP_055296774.1 zinc finger protein 628-like [Sitodiplosis mosellana]XP_055296775.1 zinc finger protein 628-like [Sitodiplosis mosellana]
MATATLLQQQQQQLQMQEHNIELMCRICAVDFKIVTEGVPIFNTDQLMDKIKNYLHIQITNLDKLSHLVCNECVRKIENFHCYAMMAHKNQELFNIMYSEKIYREHCTALSSLNTTLYREPPTPQVQQVQPKQPNTITIQPTPPIKKQKVQPQQKPIKLPPTTVITPASPQNTAQQQQQQQNQQPVAVLSTEDITIFTYQDLKLGQVIKDQELQKLILRALKWNEPGKTIEQQLDRLKNASFRGVLNNPDLLRDEDLVQLLGPYLDHGSFAPLDTNRSTNVDFSTKTMMDQNVTEMEVGVDPDLFFPYDDDESKGMDVEVTKVTKVTKPKKERKKPEPKNKTPSKKTSTAGSSSSSSVSTIIAPTSPPPKIRIKAEGLFKTAFAHSLAKNSLVPIPKPVIVVPPKIVQKATVPKPKIVEDVPSVQITIPDPQPKTITTSATVTKVSTTTSTIVDPKPVIVQSSPQPPPLIKTPTQTPTKATTQTPAKAEVSSSPVSSQAEPAKTSKSEENKPIVSSTEKEEEEEKTPSKNANPKPDTTSNATVTTAATSTTTNTTTRASPKGTAAKVESKARHTRKVKVDQSGPKTRARSIFNTRHKCAVCGKKFSTSGNLKAHVKTHKPKGKFNCDKCGRVFKTQVNLQRHHQFHLGEKFSCRTCGRVYPTNSTLKQHEISHSNFRPHKCNICLKTFKRSQDLKFHLNQHSGEKPYRCPYCPKAFASSGNCFSHRKRVHSDKLVPAPTPTTTSKRSSAVENAKKLVKA